MSHLLKGKSFFLDTSSPYMRGLEEIERRITIKGGTVEKWFHRNVSYLVTPTQEEGDGSNDENQAEDSADLTELAKEWGIRVLTPMELVIGLKKLESRSARRESKDPHSYSNRPYIRMLKPPFMKVEDQSGAYRPLIYETDVWPLPNRNSPPCECAYDSSYDSTTSISTRTTTEIQAARHKLQKKLRKRMRCLRRKRRRDVVAAIDAEFADLDQFAVEKKLDFPTFLQSMRDMYARVPVEQEIECSIVSISSPSSPITLTPPSILSPPTLDMES